MGPMHQPRGVHHSQPHADRSEMVALQFSDLHTLSQNQLLILQADRQLDEHHQTFAKIVWA